MLIQFDSSHSLICLLKQLLFYGADESLICTEMRTKFHSSTFCFSLTDSTDALTALKEERLEIHIERTSAGLGYVWELNYLS